MTVQRFYALLGADYAEAIRRIGNDDRIRKYLGILQRDDSMDVLQRALSENDADTAFRAAHTIKGSALNLGLTRLTDCSSRLTEALRPKTIDGAVAPLAEETARAYRETMARIGDLLAQPETEQP